MEQTLYDREWMGFDIVICAVVGTDDLGSQARKHWSNMQHEVREESSHCSVSFATGQGVTYTEALNFRARCRQ